jgi:hypothetical protein
MTFRGLFLASSSLVLAFLVTSCGVEKKASLGWGRNGAAETRSSRPEAGGEVEKERFFDLPRARREAARRAEADAEMAALKARLGYPQSPVPGVRPGSPEDYELRARAGLISERERKREAKRLAKLAADRKSAAYVPAPSAGAAVYSGEVAIHEVPGGGERRGWFSGIGFGKNRRDRDTPDHRILVNHAHLEGLDPSNASIEIDLGDQRARVFRKSGPMKTLVIDTQISSGKSGYETPTGRFTISEKLAEKKSTIYGVWYDANGMPMPSNGESSMKPAGATRFVGADMPCWLRITGGIGLHIGEVPGYPASHGCVRVPAAIHPLIFSKVGPGTPVTVVH